MEVETLFFLNLPNDFADPQEWSKKIGLTPLEICQRGEKVSPHPRAQISSDSYWVFGIEKRVEKSVEDQISVVLNQVYGQKEQIQKLVRSLKLEVICHVYVWIDNLNELSLIFDHELLKKITELGITFHLTRY